MDTNTNKCDEEFNEISLEHHTVTIHQNANKKHKCEICEKVFKTKIILKNHFSTVHDNGVQNTFKTQQKRDARF